MSETQSQEVLLKGIDFVATQLEEKKKVIVALDGSLCDEDTFQRYLEQRLRGREEVPFVRGSEGLVVRTRERERIVGEIQVLQEADRGVYITPLYLGSEQVTIHQIVSLLLEERLKPTDDPRVMWENTDCCRRVYEEEFLPTFDVLVTYTEESGWCFEPYSRKPMYEITESRKGVECLLNRQEEGKRVLCVIPDKQVIEAFLMDYLAIQSLECETIYIGKNVPYEGKVVQVSPNVVPDDILKRRLVQAEKDDTQFVFCLDEDVTQLDAVFTLFRKRKTGVFIAEAGLLDVTNNEIPSMFDVLLLYNKEEKKWIEIEPVYIR